MVGWFVDFCFIIYDLISLELSVPNLTSTLVTIL